MKSPQTRYAKSGDVNIAYQVFGEGALDIVLVLGWVSHLEYSWEEPSLARFLQRLGSFSRVIWFDKRGTGLSDRVSTTALPTLEQRMDDMRAVMDAVGSRRAALFGISEGGPMAIMFAATYPQRTQALILYGTYARMMRDTDYPWGFPMEVEQKMVRNIEQGWGGPWSTPFYAPSMVNDIRFTEWWAAYLRLGASPGAALALYKMNSAIDVRLVIPVLKVPSLVIHRKDDTLIRVGHGQYLAKHIQGAKYVELPGENHFVAVGDTDAIVDEVQEFLTGVRPGPEPDRVLATVLFTDIVDSTRRASTMGDRRWRDLLEQHRTLVRKELLRFRGQEVQTTGDGFLATFDGPAKAIRCAVTVCKLVRDLGIEIRAGLHTGELEMREGNISGIAVHIAARVASLAAGGEVLVTNTVRDLVAGAGIEFEDRGLHLLKGVPGEWRLFRVIKV